MASLLIRERMTGLISIIKLDRALIVTGVVSFPLTSKRSIRMHGRVIKKLGQARTGA